MTYISISIYDDALMSKLKLWTENTKIHILGPNETGRLFEIIADVEKDKPIKLPLITLSRNAGYTIQNPNKKPTTYDGYTKEATYEKSIQLNAIPITIQYQLDVYTRYLKEADAYIRELIFNIINHPSFDIIIPYNGQNILHRGTMRLDNAVEDNSDIPERFISGNFTRMTLNIMVDDAYLWDTRVRDNLFISEDSIQME